MDYKTIVILAKTLTNKGFCIAGRELYLERSQECLGGWVRLWPEDDWLQGAFSTYHYRDEDGKGLNTLDVILVPILAAKPVPGQPDVLLVSEAIRWTIKGRLPSCTLSVLLDAPSDLWIDRYSPTHLLPAANDDVFHVSQSLYLIKPKQLTFTLSQRFNRYLQRFQRKLWASFYYNNTLYQHFDVLDPRLRCLFSRQYPKQGQQDKSVTLYKKDNYYLCVSLGPRFGRQQLHYKSVATVFDFDGYLQTHYG